MLLQTDVASDFSPDNKGLLEYQKRSPPAPLIPTYDPLLDWTAYGLDDDTTMEVPGGQQLLEQQESSFFQVMENPDAMPGFLEVESDMQSQELFDNDKGTIKEQYGPQQDGYYGTTNYWPSVPVSTTSLPPISRYWQPCSEVKTALDNDNCSMSPKPDLVEKEDEYAAVSMEDQDTDPTANDPTPQFVRSRPSAAAETMRDGTGRKPRMKKVDKLSQIESQAPPLKSSGLYFSNLAEARQVVQGLNWRPRHDETLPKTQEEREHIVGELFNAIQDMSGIQDKESGSMFQKRWLGGVAGGAIKDEDASSDGSQELRKFASDAVYKPWEKERICWEIVATTERIYREGTRFVSIIDPVKLQDCENSRHLTFRERITMLGRVLRMYKARVDKLMRGGVVEEYVLCPGTLIKISVTNRQSNDIRKEHIAAGRRLKGGPGRGVIEGGGVSKCVQKDFQESADRVAVPTSGGNRKRTRKNSEGAVTLPAPQTKRSRRG